MHWTENNNVCTQFDYSDYEACIAVVPALVPARHTRSNLFLGGNYSADLGAGFACNGDNDDSIQDVGELAFEAGSYVVHANLRGSGNGRECLVRCRRHDLFQADEAAGVQAVVVNNNQATFSFTADWRRASRLRLRLSDETIGNDAATGTLIGGEVEDYLVTVAACRGRSKSRGAAAWWLAATARSMRARPATTVQDGAGGRR